MGEMETKISQDVQEYLETIYKLAPNGRPVGVTEIATYMKVAPPRVVAMLLKLARDGYVNLSESQEATLTDSGRVIGMKMNRKHRLLEVFLQNVLGIGKERVHNEACEMEQSLSDDAEVALCRYLGHPDNCPDDNKPIQPCDMPFASCEECMANKGKGMGEVGKRRENLVSISDLKEREIGKVTFIRGDSKVIRRLLDMGITTGTPLHVIKAAPFGGPVEVAVRGSKLVLGRDIASDVFVDAGRAEVKKNGETAG
jgi:DtxR family transcriptional regulator, Mn-dependent transcriptional regulator